MTLIMLAVVVCWCACACVIRTTSGFALASSIIVCHTGGGAGRGTTGSRAGPCCANSRREDVAMSRMFSKHSNSKHKHTPWTRSLIDYSAVNEYIRAHYHQGDDDDHEGRSEGDFYNNYFSGTFLEEPVYNAREGFIIPGNNDLGNSSSCGDTTNDILEEQSHRHSSHFVNHHPPSIHECGFELCHMPMPSMVDQHYWKDLHQIQQVYAKELLEVIQTKLYPSLNNNERIKHCILWNPMYRGEDLKIVPRDDINENNDDNHNLPTSSVASMVHIDTDVGAFSVDELLGMISNTRLDQDVAFPYEGIKAAIVENGHRFAIVNAWRNINPDHPVTSSPLAVMSPYYMKHTKHTTTSPVSSNAAACLQQDTSSSPLLRAFPEGMLDPTQSRWYTYPNMTHEECLLFLQYDRDVRVTSDIFHCALTLTPQQQQQHDQQHDNDQLLFEQSKPQPQPQQSQPPPPRQSFDIRAFIVFEEKVDPKFDRYRSDRVRPFLSLEESGCFCESQEAELISRRVPKNKTPVADDV
jgi:hypothetical protein